jgi:putative ABC transport system permease protein
MLIAAIGAALGLVLASWTVTFLTHSFLAQVPTTLGYVSLGIHMSWRVFAYTAGLTVVSVLAFGLAPALQATSAELTSALKGEDTLFGTRLRRSRFRDALVSVQVGACLVLLTAAATLVHSLHDFATVDTGLHARGIFVEQLGLAGVTHTPPALATARQHFADRVATLDGVDATAMAASAPWTYWQTLRVADASTHGEIHGIFQNVVTPPYFDVIGQRLVAGRGFFESDSANAAVAVVSTAAARMLWPGRNPLGQLLRVAAGTDSARIVRIVGVAADARSELVWDNDSNGYLYLPARIADLTSANAVLLVKASGSAPDIDRAIADVARETDPDAPLTSRRLTELLDEQLIPYRYTALVAAGVGVLGLALAVVGLYGVVAFAVGQRRREIAIHVAMGAAPRNVLALVLRGEMRLVLRGLAAGLVLSLGMAKLLGSIVVSLSPVGPVAIGGLAVALVGVAVLATATPALSALRLSPMRVLRQE